MWARAQAAARAAAALAGGRPGGGGSAHVHGSTTTTTLSAAAAARTRAQFAEARFVGFLGVQLVELGRGHATTELAIRPEFTQAEGYVHAGVQATMADHTAGTAAGTLVTADQTVLTAEFKVHLLRPALGPRLRAVAEVIRPGRQLHVVDAKVYSVSGVPGDADKLVSWLTATIAVVDRRDKVAPGKHAVDGHGRPPSHL